MILKKNNGKRVDSTKLELLKRRVTAAIAAGAIFGSSLGLGYLGVKNAKRNNLYNNTKIEDVLDDENFKLSSNNENFISLLESNGYEIDKDIKKEEINNNFMDNIYEMYSNIWSLEKANEELCYYEDYEIVVKNNIDKFFESLLKLLNTRMPGNIDILLDENVVLSNENTAYIESTSSNPDAIINYYGIFNNKTNKENSIIGKYELPIKEYAKYKINIKDKDLLVIMDMIINKDKIKNYDTNKLINVIKKVISAAIRVSTNDYITVYNNIQHNLESNDKLENTYFGNLVKINTSFNGLYDSIELELKKYLIKYYNLDDSIFDLTFITRNGLNNKKKWYLFNKKTNDSHLLNDKNSAILNDMENYKNMINSYYSFNEESILPRNNYDEYTNIISEKYNNTYSKIKSFKK